MGRTTRSRVSPPLGSLIERTFPTGIEAGNALRSMPLVVSEVPGLGRSSVSGSRLRVDDEVLAAALGRGRCR